MVELMTEIKENMEVDGDVELATEVSHVGDEVRNKARDVVFLPSGV